MASVTQNNFHPDTDSSDDLSIIHSNFKKNHSYLKNALYPKLTNQFSNHNINYRVCRFAVACIPTTQSVKIESNELDVAQYDNYYNNNSNSDIINKNNIESVDNTGIESKSSIINSSPNIYPSCNSVYWNTFPSQSKHQFYCSNHRILSNLPLKSSFHADSPVLFQMPEMNSVTFQGRGDGGFIPSRLILRIQVTVSSPSANTLYFAYDPFHLLALDLQQQFGLVPVDLTLLNFNTLSLSLCGGNWHWSNYFCDCNQKICQNHRSSLRDYAHNSQSRIKKQKTSAKKLQNVNNEPSVQTINDDSALQITTEPDVSYELKHKPIHQVYIESIPSNISVETINSPFDNLIGQNFNNVLSPLNEFDFNFIQTEPSSPSTSSNSFTNLSPFTFEQTESSSLDSSPEIILLSRSLCVDLRRFQPANTNNVVEWTSSFKFYCDSKNNRNNNNITSNNSNNSTIYWLTQVIVSTNEKHVPQISITPNTYQYELLYRPIGGNSAVSSSNNTIEGRKAPQKVDVHSCWIVKIFVPHTNSNEIQNFQVKYSNNDFSSLQAPLGWAAASVTTPTQNELEFLILFSAENEVLCPLISSFRRQIISIQSQRSQPYSIFMKKLLANIQNNNNNNNNNKDNGKNSNNNENKQLNSFKEEDISLFSVKTENQVMTARWLLKASSDNNGHSVNPLKNGYGYEINWVWHDEFFPEGFYQDQDLET